MIEPSEQIGTHRISLDKTVIKSPIDMRVPRVNINMDQY